jgi:ribosomal protein S27E
MKINPDKTIRLEKGEYIPFVCPKCNQPIEYDEKVFMVKCHRCSYLGIRSEFDREYIFKKV